MTFARSPKNSVCAFQHTLKPGRGSETRSELGVSGLLEELEGEKERVAKRVSSKVLENVGTRRWLTELQHLAAGSVGQKDIGSGNVHDELVAMAKELQVDKTQPPMQTSTWR